MAGMAKTVPSAAVTQGVSGAVDEGTFRESLQASVGRGVLAGGALLQSVPGAKPLSAGAVGTPLGTRVPAALVAGASPAAMVTVSATVAAPANVPVGAAVTSGLTSPDAATVQPGGAKPGGGMEAAVSAQHVAGTGRSAGGVIEAPPGTKPVEVAEGEWGAAGTKASKGDREAVGKRVASKDVEGGAASPATVVVEPASLTLAASGSVPVGGVQPIAVVATPVAASVPEAQGEGKATKALGPSGVGKRSGRETKGVDSALPVDVKRDSGAAAAPSVAGSSVGHLVGKDGVVAIAAQGVAGAGVTAPVGVGASHVTGAGIAVAKVAANVDGVTASTGQGSAAGDQVKTLAATPNLLEVGIDSGTHGWLRVRAELGQTGEVTASMVAGSAGQADTLRRELPAMSTYLAGESVGVSSLVVNAAGAGAAAQDAATSLGAGVQGGGGDGRGQGSGMTPQSGGQGATGAGEMGVSGLEFSGEELPAAVHANGSGSWLSVRV